MNTDPQKSAQNCGCDEGANWTCEACRGKRRIVSHETMGEIIVVTPTEGIQTAQIIEKDSQTDIAFCAADAPYIGAQVGSHVFGDGAQERKDAPIFTGVLLYFPLALAEVARVSKRGNDQHNPGEPLHWARNKSTDQMDTTTRHMVDHGTGHVRDADGGYHLAKAAWRILAELELTLEKERGL